MRLHAWFEIRATAFKEQCDKYYNLCEVGKVYLINNCALKPANKQYSTLNNDYELTFRDSTEMQMVSDEDTSAIPSLSFEFVKISDLSANDKDKVSWEGRNDRMLRLLYLCPPIKQLKLSISLSGKLNIM